MKQSIEHYGKPLPNFLPMPPKENSRRGKTPEQPLATDIASLAHELEQMRAQQEQTHRVVTAIQEKLDLILAPRIKMQDRSELTARQATVFEDIERLPGSDPETRAAVKKLLDTLEGEPITEALVIALKHTFKVRAWGVLCTCGEPAAVRWQRSLRCALGGYMLFSHTGPKGKSVSHGGHTTLPTFTLVERPDKRRRGSKEGTK